MTLQEAMDLFKQIAYGESVSVPARVMKEAYDTVESYIIQIRKLDMIYAREALSKEKMIELFINGDNK